MTEEKKICFYSHCRTRRELEMFDKPDLTFDQMILYASDGISIIWKVFLRDFKIKKVTGNNKWRFDPSPVVLKID